MADRWHGEDRTMDEQTPRDWTYVERMSIGTPEQYAAFLDILEQERPTPRLDALFARPLPWAVGPHDTREATVQDQHASGVHIYCEPPKYRPIGTASGVIGRALVSGCEKSGTVERFHSHDFDGPLPCCDGLTVGE